MRASNRTPDETQWSLSFTPRGSGVQIPQPAPVPLPVLASPGWLCVEPVEHHGFRTIPLTRGYSALVDAEDLEIFGCFNWTAAVQVAGRRVYAYRNVRGIDGKLKTTLLHRAIMGAGPGQIVDHADRNTLDCRRSNLRFATHIQNCWNREQNRSTSGFIGVDSQTPGKWRGRVAAHGRSYYTSTFPSPLQAAIARDVLARELHGSFAIVNFPAQATA